MSNTDTPDAVPAARVASYAHVDAQVGQADGMKGSAPWWHGWALREAFEAGVRWQNEQTPPDPEWAKMDPSRVIALLKAEAQLDAAMLERMLRFAIDAAQQQQVK